MSVAAGKSKSPVQRELPPFRAEVVGSLLRPQALVDAREGLASGRVTAEELRAVEDKAVQEAVKMQESAGLQVVTDGEFRRGSWHMDFLHEVGGIAVSTEQSMTITFKDGDDEVDYAPPALHVVEKVGLTHTIFGDHFTSLKSMTSVTPKITIPSLNLLHLRAGSKGFVDRSVYADDAAAWADISAAWGQEVRGLHDLGCTYLQIDDTTFANLTDPRNREKLAARGEDSETLHLTYVDRLNESLQGRPDDMTIGVHMCRGNFRSSWNAEGDYEFVAEAVFNELNVDAFFLEFDDERSGGFEPLRHMPAGKFAVLGLVTSKSGALESKDELKRRVDEAAKFIPMDQLCLSPQCGFASTIEGNSLTESEQQAKLELVVETADEIWSGK